MRTATADDILEILRMGREFAQSAQVSFERESFVRTIEGLLENQWGTVIFTDGGMIGGLIYPAWFDDSVLIAQEFFWWVDESKRQTGLGEKLLKAFENWAREAGAEKIVMVALHSMSPKKVGKIYKDRGFTPHEYSYVKEVE